jgi:LPXTG-motif cell wall-anchored protein
MSNFAPTAEQVTEKAYCGFFYQRPSSKASVTVAQIAYAAAQRAGGAISTANLVRLIAESPWNQAHFTYALKGSAQNYTNYGFPGPQYAKSGGAFPLLWVPTPEGAEPEDVFGGAPAVVTVRPGVEPAQPTRTISAGGGGTRVRAGAGTGAGAATLIVGGSDDGYGAGDVRPGSQLPGDPGMQNGGAGYGNGGTMIVSEGPPWGWIVLGGGALVALGVFWWRRRKKR